MGRQELPAHSPFVGRNSGFQIGAARGDSALPLAALVDYRDAAMNARHSPAGSSRFRSSHRPPSLAGLLVAGLVVLPSTADAAHVKGHIEGFRSLQNPVWAE